jgi:hypothetical protein
MVIAMRFGHFALGVVRLARPHASISIGVEMPETPNELWSARWRKGRNHAER